ncbi:MAG: hypothetical protein ACXWSZ_11490 [Bdellovibrionota bacterium]
MVIAGALLIGLAMGAYQLLGNVSKSAGDLEKRAHFRDLAEDIRFVFSQPGLCEEATRDMTFSEDAPVSLPLRPGLVLETGTSLPDYGLKITRLTMKNVRAFPAFTKTLLKPNGEIAGVYSEESVVADIFLEASLLGSNHALKGQNVSRIAITHRRGVITESLCYGNHEQARGHVLPAQGGQASSLTQTGQSDFSVSGETTPFRRAGKRVLGGGQGGGHAECAIRDPRMAKATGFRKLAHGGVIQYRDPQGEVNDITCEDGTLQVLRRE